MAAPTTEVGTTTILMVRHAEVYNPQRVMYGRLPEFRLSDYGEKQAERTAAFLADWPIAAIYSSPLLRAQQSADKMAAHHPGASRHTSDRLLEIGTSWEGTPFAQLKPGFTVYENRRVFGDESIADVQARMVAFVEEVRARHPGATIAAVSHGDPITILKVALSGRAVTQAAIRGSDYAGLGSVTEIVYAPGETAPRLRTLRP